MASSLDERQAAWCVPPLRAEIRHGFAYWGRPSALIYDVATAMASSRVRFALRTAAVVSIAVAVLAGSACRSIGGATAASSPNASASAKASTAPTPPSKLDAAVPTPSGFPSDVPVYPGARLTAGATFTSNGQTAWGVEWETLDTVDKVQAFYKSQLSQGDWAVQFSGSANGQFSATFTRKSNSKVVGILGADASSGVTKISLSLNGG
jgi:hypothetical protein